MYPVLHSIYKQGMYVPVDPATAGPNGWGDLSVL